MTLWRRNIKRINLLLHLQFASSTVICQNSSIAGDICPEKYSGCLLKWWNVRYLWSILAILCLCTQIFAKMFASNIKQFCLHRICAGVPNLETRIAIKQYLNNNIVLSPSKCPRGSSGLCGSSLSICNYSLRRECRSNSSEIYTSSSWDICIRSVFGLAAVVLCE